MKCRLFDFFRKVFHQKLISGRSVTNSCRENQILLEISLLPDLSRALWLIRESISESIFEAMFMLYFDDMGPIL